MIASRSYDRCRSNGAVRRVAALKEPLMTHSERLRQKIELVMPELVALSSAILFHPQFAARLYVELMIRMHQMVRTSVPLMRASLRRCEELAPYDPIAAVLAPYLEQHILKEAGHDEWLLEDLELIGVPRAEVLKRLPSPAVAAVAGQRYYWVLHHHPLAEMGGLAAMEGYPMKVGAIDAMERVTRYPRAAFRTLEKHAHLDPAHCHEIMNLIDSLPLTEEQHELLGVSALATMLSVTQVYREILEIVPAEA